MSEEDRSSKGWNAARSKPLLLIKPSGNRGIEPLAESDYPALLTDIMPTIFDSLRVPYSPPNGRVSLLEDALPDRPTRYYHFYEKGENGLQDGQLMRFVIDGDEIRFDRNITLPVSD